MGCCSAAEVIDLLGHTSRSVQLAWEMDAIASKASKIKTSME
jgi:hypothetical protein